MGAVRRVAVLGGGGLMGHGIALACLTGSDADVVLISRREESVAQGLEWVRTGQYGLDRAVARGKLTPEATEAAKGRVSGTTDSSAPTGSSRPTSCPSSRWPAGA